MQGDCIDFDASRGFQINRVMYRCYDDSLQAMRKIFVKPDSLNVINFSLEEDHYTLHLYSSIPVEHHCDTLDYYDTGKLTVIEGEPFIEQGIKRTPYKYTFASDSGFVISKEYDRHCDYIQLTYALKLMTGDSIGVPIIN